VEREIFRGEGDLEEELVGGRSKCFGGEEREGGGGHEIEGGTARSMEEWRVVGRGAGSTDLLEGFCCMRQWILNQLDLLPYLDPDFDIPTMRHFLRRQALQAVLFFLSTTQR